MKHLIEIPLEDGSAIIVEVGDEQSMRAPSLPMRGIRDDLVEKVERTFEAALDRVKPAADVIIEKLRALSQAPSEIGVEFGIKIGVKGNAFIASADTEANFKVTLKWQRDK